MLVDSSPALKRRRFTTIDPMDAESAKAKLAAAKEKFGRDVRVFETFTSSSSTPTDVANTEEPDDFYEFKPEDYYRLLGTKKEDKYLKTRKLREAEEAARRSKITKQAVIRVRFPDNYTVEANFHSSETLQSLFDLVVKVVAHPELPFYLYTTPPKKQLKDMSQDFYSVGFVPGAIVYFSYNLPKGDDTAAASGPFLLEEVISLQGLELMVEQAEPPQPSVEPVATTQPAAIPAASSQKPTDKKNIKPKWLKL